MWKHPSAINTDLSWCPMKRMYVNEISGGKKEKSISEILALCDSAPLMPQQLLDQMAMS